METFAELLATGDAGSLVLSVVAFTLAGLLAALAVRIRPRPRRRVAR
jgi:LPXTG-motif cell wall-anchored protein